ncbi:MAG: heavy metal translocating P-type ATPase [Planctomycetota bacterium]
MTAPTPANPAAATATATLPPVAPSFGQSLQKLWAERDGVIAVIALIVIAVHLVLRFLWPGMAPRADLPLAVGLIVGGTPLVLTLAWKALRGQFGSDLLAGISIVTSVVLDQYLAGMIVVLMLSGGEALESYAVHSASSVLNALAKRMPSVAHRRVDRKLVDVALQAVQVGDLLTVLPHEICPVDGLVVEGQGTMDEAYLTGEPYNMSKSPGSDVLSGAINGEAALSIRAVRRAVDSRYAKIMQVMQDSQQHRPRIRRLGDQLGAWYTPLAVAIALAAWYFSGQSVRFLAVLVTATPCPLLIAIPIAIIGAISLSARRGIIIRDPAILEQIGKCRTMIFDKTGTLTYGEPRLTNEAVVPGFDRDEILQLTASLEQYSRHPLAAPILQAAQARRLVIELAERVAEKPGEGLVGHVHHREVTVTSRRKLLQVRPDFAAAIPELDGGLECVVLVDGRYAASYRFRDEPRAEGAHFVNHLQPRHRFTRLMLVSGDRESEVQYLAEQVGIAEIHANQSPEQKLAIVRAETARARTLYVGDGINDAPALLAATVGLAMGQKSEVTTAAAGAVIMDNSLAKVDELMHVGARMRSIALQSALAGIALSLIAMSFAAFGHLPPVLGALTQEVIDVAVVLNALRAARPPAALTDY